MLVVPALQLLAARGVVAQPALQAAAPMTMTLRANRVVNSHRRSVPEEAHLAPAADSLMVQPAAIQTTGEIAVLIVALMKRMMMMMTM